ncbi:aldose 1-epimerase family protein [Nocardiopsis sediminis]|uniref:Aldose 1-epimerase family protein n=1 Tax=Nocardiopsis sediminis TaxID=1778267 RepID=A0ABV8FUH5_9ACTN
MADVIELAAGGYRAVVGRHGAGLLRLEWRGHDLVWPCDDPADPVAFQGRLLAPWPNRVADGRYVFAGAEHCLTVTEPERATALHGLVHSATWLPVETGPDRVRLAFTLDGAPGYPFRLELAADYRLDPAEGLHVHVGARNIGAAAAPYGTGAHPYLRVAGALDDAVLRLPARSRLPVDGRLLPAGAPEPVEGTEHDFGNARRIGATVFDTAFTGLRRDAEGRAWTVLSGGGRSVGLWADESFGWLQVFSADGLPGGLHRSGLAVEPMTCPPNAFATGTDLAVLAPGAVSGARFGIRALEPGRG